MIEPERYDQILNGTDTENRILESIKGVNPEPKRVKAPWDKTEDELKATVKDAQAQLQKFTLVTQLTEWALPAGFRYMPDLLEYINRLTCERDLAREHLAGSTPKKEVNQNVQI